MKFGDTAFKRERVFGCQSQWCDVEVQNRFEVLLDVHLRYSQIPMLYSLFYTCFGRPVSVHLSSRIFIG